MNMCYNAYDLSLVLNAILSFLILISSNLLFSDEVLSQSILVPVKSDYANEAAILAVVREGDQNIKKLGSILTPAWFGPRLRRKRESTPKGPGWFGPRLIHKVESTPKNPAWFGSRLGRKKRSIPLEDEILDMLDDRSQKNSIDDDIIVMKNPLTLPLIVEGYVSKRQFMKPKPRLGRGNSWSDDDDEMIKAPPFSPRLGRRSLVPLKPRLGRAGTSPETAVFKPRMGRDPNFNEFNEYTDTRNSVDDKDH